MPADIIICPQAPDLERLLLGKVSDAEAAALERHVDECTLCQQSLQTLDVQDQLVDIARAGGFGPTPDLSSKVASLIERLGKSVPSVAWTTSAGEIVPKDEPSPAELLGPPLEPDELGRLGSYRVLRVQSRGGMGIVFQAEDTQLRRLVAIKIMSPRLAAEAAARERFLREARAAAAVEHDHIVPIFQVGEDRGHPFLVMPLLKGETLDSRLQRDGTMPPAEVVRIGRQIAEGLAAAHARGLIHRDIKPANIWLEGERGRVKILDFGLVRAVEAERFMDATSAAGPAGVGATQTGLVLGTPAYMAPEQARGEAIDARADLFSLGVVLYRMATGRLPFAGQSLREVVASLERDEPPPPRSVNPLIPRALSDLTMRLLVKDRAARPATARSVVEALATVEPRRRRRLPWLLTAAALLALVLWLGVYMMSANDQPDIPQAADPEPAGVTFAPPLSVAVGKRPSMMATGDFNGDGKLDLAVSNLNSGTVSVLLGNGDGTLRPTGEYPVATKDPQGIAVADFDGDGHVDLIIAAPRDHRLCLLRGNGDGTFQPVEHIPAHRYPHFIVAHDFNADGKIDIAVTCSTNSGGVCVMLGNGDGTFGQPTFYADGINAAFLHAADLNGDGRLDLVVSSDPSGTVSVFLGNGDGTFQFGVPYPAGDSPVLRGVLDVNGDGKRDLVVSNHRGSLMRTLLGRGDGTFGEAKPSGTAVDFGGFALADFNRDGRVDLVVLERLSNMASSLKVSLGRKDGTWNSAPAKEFAFRSDNAVAGDFNGDGRPDLAVPDSVADKVHVLLNQPLAQRLSITMQVRTPVGGTRFITFSAQDLAGNAAAGYTGTVKFHCDTKQTGLPEQFTFTTNHGGVMGFEVTFHQPGPYTLSLVDTNDPTLRSEASGVITPAP